MANKVQDNAGLAQEAGVISARGRVDLSKTLVLVYLKKTRSHLQMAFPDIPEVLSRHYKE